LIDHKLKTAKTLKKTEFVQEVEAINAVVKHYIVMFRVRTT